MVPTDRMVITSERLAISSREFLDRMIFGSMRCVIARVITAVDDCFCPGNTSFSMECLVLIVGDEHTYIHTYTP